MAASYNTGGYNRPREEREMFLPSEITGSSSILFQFGEADTHDSLRGFNTQSYNISRPKEQFLDVRLDGASFIDGFHGIDSFVPGTLHGRSVVNSESRLEGIIITQMNVTSLFDSELVVTPLFLTRINAKSAFDSDLWLGAIIQPDVTAKSTFDSVSWMGAEFHTDLNGRSAFNVDLWLGAIFYTSVNANSFFHAILSAEIRRYLTAIINVSIPAGGELRIDSDVFTVFLGQQNILHLYQGDWMNFNRNARSISIEAGNAGNISGDIVYNERFL